ncbi:G patch domain-containing protein 4 [Malaya genurostris]|uniref:G patch domain-containing protein 4 n=1 Tax=Malaya genurostris TaxID=325434 RepID=UPI0026F3F56C|nr:G patch domain-containing protein 4 [Malaya genurostris]
MGDYLGSVALPSMKERQKKLCQTKLKPRAEPVYNDSTNFGVRMLEKLGWSEGKGLGKKEDGMAAPILPKLKQDSEGFGYAGEKDNHWTQHDQDFNQLLKSLNGEDGTTEDQGELARIKSLEEKSKNSRARVHYKKFTRGKDLSRASAKDLANIFGKRSLNEVKLQTSELETDKKPSNISESEETNMLGLTTINASMSLQEYFKSKMRKKFKTEEDATHNKAEVELHEQLAETSTATIEANEICKKKKCCDVHHESNSKDTQTLQQLVTKKKKKNKRKKSLEKLEQNDTPMDRNSTETQIVPEIIEKQKKKRKSRLADQTDSSTPNIFSHLNEEAIAEVSLNAIGSAKNELDTCSRNDNLPITQETPIFKQKKKSKSRSIEQQDLKITTISGHPNVHRELNEATDLDVSSGIVEKKIASHDSTEYNIKSKTCKQKKKRKSRSMEEQDPKATTIASHKDDHRTLSETTVHEVSSGVVEKKPIASSDSTKCDNLETVTESENTTDEVTYRVKISVLKQLNEHGFPGSNFADIVGYGLTQDVKLIKHNTNRKQTLEKHQFVRNKQTSLKRKRQMLKKVSAFQGI